MINMSSVIPKKHNDYIKKIGYCPILEKEVEVDGNKTTAYWPGNGNKPDCSTKYHCDCQECPWGIEHCEAITGKLVEGEPYITCKECKEYNPYLYNNCPITKEQQHGY